MNLTPDPHELIQCLGVWLQNVIVLAQKDCTFTKLLLNSLFIIKEAKLESFLIVI